MHPDRIQGAAATSVLDEIGSGILPFNIKSGEMPSSLSYACRFHLFAKACDQNTASIIIKSSSHC